MTVLPEGFSVEERSRRAMEYFQSGYNCCQAVAMTFSDIAGIDKETLAVLGSGFGGGFGRMREVCGTVTGMTMIAGTLIPVDKVGDREAKTANYALVQELASEFREINGSVVCRVLLGLDRKSASGRMFEPVPEERTEAYYKKRPCKDLVGVAAAILAGKIIKMYGER